MAITVRSASAGGSGSSNVTTITPTLPSGWQPGDMVLLCGYVNTTAATWSQTAGTGLWSVHQQAAMASGGGIGSFLAWKIMVAGDTAPTFTKTSGGARSEWSAVALTPDAGDTLAIDTWAATTIDTAAAASHTPGAATAAGSGEASVIFNCIIAGATGSNTISWTDSANWTQQATNQYNGAVGNDANFIDVITQTGLTGTVTPGSESSGALNTQAVIYHVLVTEISGTGTQLYNNFEQGTPGETITTGNSGGPGSTAFDGVTIGTGATVSYDSTHVAHGSAAAELATSGTTAQASFRWGSALTGGGNPTQLWFRFYAYFTANPAATTRLFYTTLSGTRCASLQILTTGKLQFLNTSGSTIFSTTATISLNQWIRVEGRIGCSATVGQVELLLFNTADSWAPTEVDTSTFAQNTNTAIDTALYGQNVNLANMGPYWLDSVALSTTGYLGPDLTSSGPAFHAQTHPVQAPVPQIWSKGRTSGNAGAPVSNPIPILGTPFYPLNHPARAPVPQAFSKGRHGSNAGAPVANPTSGPPVKPLTGPIQARRPLFLLGRSEARPGAAVQNATPGPAVYPLESPVRGRLPQPHPRAGRVASGPGTPVANPTAGPLFYPLRHPVHASIPQVFSKGRASGNAGAPVSNPVPPPGPPFYPLNKALRAQPAVFRNGRATGSPGAPVRNPPPALGPPFYPLNKALRAQPAVFRTGRQGSNRGAPLPPVPPPVFTPGSVTITRAGPLAAVVTVSLP